MDNEEKKIESSEEDSLRFMGACVRGLTLTIMYYLIAVLFDNVKFF